MKKEFLAMIERISEDLQNAENVSIKYGEVEADIRIPEGSTTDSIMFDVCTSETTRVYINNLNVLGLMPDHDVRVNSAIRSLNMVLRDIIHEDMVSNMDNV